MVATKPRTVSTVTARRLSGCSHRQCYHWQSRGYIEPLVAATGSGSRIRWSEEDVRILATLFRMASHGVSTRAFGRVAEVIRKGAKVIVCGDDRAWGAETDAGLLALLATFDRPTTVVAVPGFAELDRLEVES